jgi:UDP-N-acetylmuramate dehydrogenase
MNIFSDMKKIVRTNEPLADHTWFRIGGPAKYFITPESTEQLSEVVQRCRDNDVPMYVIGRGANLLIADAGVDGAVIHLSADAFKRVVTNEGSVTAGAGKDMGRVVLRTMHEGMSGLEALAGIPGTVGGCVRMNAGGSFGDLGSAIKRVTVMDEDGNIFDRHKEDLAFAYRSSNIGSKFILSAEFEVTDDDPYRILKQVRQIWMVKKNAQPLANRSAGCIFRNPRGMSAGALIDRAGMKGQRVGGAHVSEKHANFILADEGVTAFDVLKLIDKIRDAVAKESNVLLEKEIQVW